jgi:heavy metal sensor kinase
MTLRLRLTLWYTALLGATLILFSVGVYSALSSNLWVQTQQEAERQAKDLATVLTRQIEGDIIIGRPLTSDIFQIEELAVDAFASNVYAQFIDLHGAIHRQSAALNHLIVPGYKNALSSIRQHQTHYYYFEIGGGRGHALVYSVPVVALGEIVGAVQVIQTVKAVEETLAQASRYLILGTALSLILAAIVGAFLARRALAPIGMITQTASSITRTQDLEQRLNIPNDASEVGELAATFNEMLDRIQRLFRTQERLVADVSHELRTPLTTMQGNLEILQRVATAASSGQPQSPAFATTLQETLREVEGETTRMTRLINDLLLLAQADSGALRLQMAPVEMDTLLLEVYRQTKRLAEQRNGANGWDIRLGSEDQAQVWGDRERLRQLLLNLADNALKYTPDGGIIRLSLVNREGWVQVAVSDTGMGIPPEQQEQIFERFYRTDKARSRELGGSGLGLSIVQWIAQAHNGRVTVESKPQVGSTFTLWLPEFQSATPSAGAVLTNNSGNSRIVGSS